MGSNDQNVATALHNRECPVDYQCMDTDCIECLKLHQQKGARMENAEEYTGRSE